MTIKLFTASTIVPKYHNYANVTFDWFVWERQEKLVVRYADLIDGYDSLREESRFYSEAYINELFTETEVNAFATWLLQVFGANCNIKAAEVPVEKNAIGLSALPVGGSTDFHMIHRHPKYDLPFDVEGYFDTRFADHLPHVDNNESFPL